MGRPRSKLVSAHHSNRAFSKIASANDKPAIAVRVRPPLRPTDPGFELIPQRFQRSMVHNLSPTSLAIDSPHGRKLFVFDRVFGEDVQQEGVWEYVDESVNAFVQGYNVSVLAYGQSGSGKSFTMGTSGPAEQSDLQLMGTLKLPCHNLSFRVGRGQSSAVGNFADISRGRRNSSRCSSFVQQAFRTTTAEQERILRPPYAY